MSFDDQGYLGSAKAAARIAGAKIRASIGKQFTIENKGPSDLVTSVDRDCELLIRNTLAQEHPEVAFWGEEFGREDSHSRLTWLVDPLDGTKNFVHGYPFIAVSIALLKDEQPVVAAVYDPLRDEIFHASLGKGSFCNEIPIEVSHTRSLNQAIVATSFSGHPQQQKELIWQACLNCQGLRRGGASALDLCQVAAGRLDAMWEWYLRPWDLAAAVLIIQEAKGTVSDMKGSSFQLTNGQVLATNTNLHKQMVDFISQESG